MIFSIIDANSFFEQLVKPQYNEFLENNSSDRHALLTVILVYHLYEWVFSNKFKKDNFLIIFPNKDRTADFFEYARKLANGTKHFNVKIKTKKQKGFSSAFNESFSRSLIIEGKCKEDDISIDFLLAELICFWENYFMQIGK